MRIRQMANGITDGIRLFALRIVAAPLKVRLTRSFVMPRLHVSTPCPAMTMPSVCDGSGHTRSIYSHHAHGILLPPGSDAAASFT